MLELAIVILTLFGYGLIRGTSTCATICAPALLPYVAMQEMNTRQAVKVGVLFNLPRVLVLTALGAVVGAASHTIFTNDAFNDSIIVTHGVAYSIIGLMLVLFGLHMLYTRSGTDEECKPRETKHKKWRGRTPLLPKWAMGGNRFVIIWGSVLSFACLLEIGLLETLAVSTFLGGSSGEVVGAALVGAGAMAAFAIGAAIPVIVLLVLANRYTDMRKPRHRQFFDEVLPWMLVVAGIFLIVMTVRRF